MGVEMYRYLVRKMSMKTVREGGDDDGGQRVVIRVLVQCS